MRSFHLKQQTDWDSECTCWCCTHGIVYLLFNLLLYLLIFTYLLIYFLLINEEWWTNKVFPAEAVDREDGHHFYTSEVRFERTSTKTWTLIHFKVNQSWAAQPPITCTSTVIGTRCTSRLWNTNTLVDQKHRQQKNVQKNKTLKPHNEADAGTTVQSQTELQQCSQWEQKCYRWCLYVVVVVVVVNA